MPSSSSSSSFDEQYDEFENEIVQASFQYLITHYNQSRIPKKVRQPRRYIERDHEEGYHRLYNDYFSPNPTYTPELFRRRFRMRRPLFLHLVNAVEDYDTYFQPTPDNKGRLGISALQKCTAAIRILAYGESSDRNDEYLRLSGAVARESLVAFTNAVVAVFVGEYMRSPTVADLQRLLQIGERRGFPGMLESIDCMHWQWKNCPVAWRGQFQGRSGKATILLEVVASEDLWIWHSFFGIPGSCNDLTVFHRSPIFDNLLNGRAPRVNYAVSNKQYDMGYYLADGIYPKWATFIPTITLPQTPKDRLFAERQESTRKDVERTFGVLQARFAIIRKPALSWDERMLNNIMSCCIIIHNMIVEDERDSYANYQDPSSYDADVNSTGSSVQNPEHEIGYVAGIDAYIANRVRARDRAKHISLKKDLVENIWARFGNDN